MSDDKMINKNSISIRLRVLFLCLVVLSGFSCSSSKIVEYDHVDYDFEVSGKVTHNGNPIQGVEISLSINKPVYDVITPVSIVKARTSENGDFVFSYIADSPKIKYEVTFFKDGFEKLTVEGVSDNRKPLKVELNLAR